ncbi:Malate/lactate/ureidoglycolate dehydrogenase, LDH2 family [Paracoccus alcaliphilus]|uniref:Malate/lactate/ureidoglycolate dehydrogenase, LDH2 family n=1 Tax=Paracoccus alcaliphilus TaxID=34002 RepID=A0A1H8NK09_9RHOB|nr:Ldh family oxidoreductase [Paracoccus alcaliphilus]SEO29713.1 Malate/lactate/ureidoglycolate dehydrogenase, LDH2 family [Paracoccus alcaliphilus]
MKINVKQLERTAMTALSKLTSQENAAQQVDLLLEADLRGVASHGMLRLPRIIRRIRNGAADPAQTGQHAWRGSALLQVEGCDGLGPVVANAAIGALESRISETGVAVAAIRNSNHLGMLGYYAERAALKGLTMIALTTSEALVHPWGGRRAMIGTNPIAIGLPAGQKGQADVFMMDAATSLVSMGEIHDHANRDLPIPEDWALDAEGRPTTDASAAKAGAIAPFGKAKGYALGLAFELLVTSLSRAAIGRDVSGTLDDTATCNKGDLFILIDGPGHDLRPYLQALREEAPAEGFTQVTIPGERGRAARDQRLRDGVDLPEPLWREICDLAR